MTTKTSGEVMGRREAADTRIRDGLRRSEERVRRFLEQYQHGGDSDHVSEKDAKKT